MGFFDFIVGGKKKTSDKSGESGGEKKRFRFSTSTQLHTELYHELKHVLDEEQREKVQEIIARYMGSGGVTYGEIDTWILRELRKLRDGKDFTHVEYEAIVRFLHKR